MGRRDELIQAIIQSPADDDLRQVFADYLEETGDPRAELARIPFLLEDAPEFSSERKEILSRERLLLREYGPFIEAPPATKATAIRGGFVEGLAMTCQRFMTDKRRLFQQLPLRGVCLKGKRGKLAELAKWPGLRKLESLQLNIHNNSESELIWMLGSQHLSNLTALEIYGMEVGSLAMKTLCSLASFHRLRRLSMRCLFGSTILQQISQSTVLKNLVDLELHPDHEYHVDEPATPPPLATDGALANLRSLCLPAITDEHLQALAACSGATLTTMRIFPSGLNSFSLLADFPHLRRLQVRGAALGRSEELVRSFGIALKQCPELVNINLSHNHLGDADAAQIASHVELSRLHRLALCRNEIGVAGANALAASPHIPRHCKILLWGNPLNELQQEQLGDRHGRSRLDFRGHDIPRSEFVPR